MKSIVVYYSYEGSTEYFANALAKKIGADILKLKAINEMKSKGFSKFVFGGYQAVMNKKPKLESHDFDLNGYDTIIFGSPVWAGGFTPPILSFFDKEKITGKNVAYFYCHQGGNKKVDESFRRALSENNIIGSIDLLTNKVEKEVNSTKLIDWAANLFL